jgi:hypothetical protein
MNHGKIVTRSFVKKKKNPASMVINKGTYRIAGKF